MIYRAFNFVADVWSSLSRNELAVGVLLLVALLTIYVLAVTAIKVTRDQFARKPPVGEDLEKLRLELTKLAPREIVDPIVAQLGSFATTDDIEAVKTLLRGYVDQAQLDRRMTEMKDLVHKIEVDHDAQLKEIRAYVHEEVHAFRNQAMGVWTNAEHQREGLHSRINVIAEALSEVRGWVRAMINNKTSHS